MLRSNQKKILTLLVGLLLLSGVIFAFVKARNGADASSATDAKSTVTQFGLRLKMVSLLASAADIRTAFETYYSPFVSPELLLFWEMDSSRAPGRRTSSPWPDRIEIVSVKKINTSLYEVQGNVIELTSAELARGGIASTYPIALRVERLGEKWLITSVEL